MKALVISAHPDDETLGCGGTLLKHRSRGDDLHWMIVSGAHFPKWPMSVLRMKTNEIKAVAAGYSMKSVHKLGFPAAFLDAIPQHELIGEIRRRIEKIRPQTVYLVHRGDVHSDHRAVFEAASSVLKSFYMGRYGVRRVYSYETLSSTDAAPPVPGKFFVPNVFVDISKFMDQKLKIMMKYKSERQGALCPRSVSAIRALGRVRGAAVGVRYAEAFSLIREVDL